jgi:cytochrome d ubiquinol oxidase subunit II
MESGIILSMIFPSLTNLKNKKVNLYTPIWELTNVFFIFGITAFFVLFNNAIVQVSKFALVPLAIGGFGLLLRAIFGIYVFYSRNQIKAWTKICLLIASYITPLSLSFVGAYLFTDKNTWDSSTGIYIVISTFIGISLIGLSFANRFKQKIVDRTKYLLYLLFMVWAIIIGYLIPRSLSSFPEPMLRAPLTALALSFAVCTVIYFLYCAVKDKAHELYQFCLLLGFITPIFFSLDLRPYIIYGSLTIDQGYGAQAYQSSIIIGTIITLPLLILGFILLYKILRLEFKK